MKYIFGQLYQEVSPTVVTVQREGKEVHYGTGFVLLSEERYSLIFTSASIIGSKQELAVYFGEDFRRIAKVLCLEPKVPFAILIVETDDQHKAITFSEDPAKRQLTTTIGAISSEGVLGNFKGFVFTPSCAAFDDSGQHLVGSEDYFLLKCTFQDDDFEDDDTEMLHTADKLISAPIFGLNGTVVGLVASAGGSSDVKIGLHTKAIYNYLKRLCGGAEWKKLLKGLAERFCNKERRTSKSAGNKQGGDCTRKKHTDDIQKASSPCDSYLAGSSSGEIKNSNQEASIPSPFAPAYPASTSSLRSGLPLLPRLPSPSRSGGDRGDRCRQIQGWKDAEKEEGQ